jgi:hypothetical protein
MIGFTGEKCPESGLWKCISCGKKVILKKNNIFPLCEKCQITTWKLVHEPKKNNKFKTFP